MLQGLWLKARFKVLEEFAALLAVNARQLPPQFFRFWCSQQNDVEHVCQVSLSVKALIVLALLAVLWIVLVLHDDVLQHAEDGFRL